MKLSWWLCGLAWWAATASAEPWLFVGDSHTAKGHWVKGFVEQWPTAMEHQVLAQGGIRPDEVLQKLRDETWKLPWDAGTVVVMLGSNAYDTKSMVAIVEWFQEASWKVVVVAPPPRRPKKTKGYTPAHANARFNADMKGLASKQKEWRWIDVPLALMDGELVKERGGDWLLERYDSDGTHLNVEGYLLLGKEVARALLEGKRGRNRGVVRLGFTTEDTESHRVSQRE